MATRQRWDIFCAVVDNFGDIGVSWRLARQLAAEHGLAVRLWLDHPASLAKLQPAYIPELESQFMDGVEIHVWTPEFPEIEPADVVVEAFGCPLPENYLQAMSEQTRAPVWINLEYLSAETWVEGCHALPSPHPRLPLTKYFFFPGFTPATGGVLREHGLALRRSHFQHLQASCDDFWASLGLPPRVGDEMRISLFGYENPGVNTLLAGWAASDRCVTCLVPEGRLLSRMRAGDSERQGNLTLLCLPFLPQSEYDRLLWACDCNFVRGEDSFVRAQWAARPMVWQIYPQAEQAHLAKLEAFLDRYGENLMPDAAQSMRRFWLVWNSAGEDAIDWWEFWRHETILRAHAEAWALRLQNMSDLATNLVQFCYKAL